MDNKLINWGLTDVWGNNIYDMDIVLTSCWYIVFKFERNVCIDFKICKTVKAVDKFIDTTPWLSGVVTTVPEKINIKNTHKFLKEAFQPAWTHNGLQCTIDNLSTILQSMKCFIWWDSYHYYNSMPDLESIVCNKAFYISMSDKQIKDALTVIPQSVRTILLNTLKHTDLYNRVKELAHKYPNFVETPTTNRMIDEEDFWREYSVLVRSNPFEGDDTSKDNENVGTEE